MENWEQISALLSQEIDLWQQITENNQVQIQRLAQAEGSFSEEPLAEQEKLLQIQDDLLVELASNQDIFDSVRLMIAAQPISLDPVLKQEISDKNRQLTMLHELVQQQQKQIEDSLKKNMAFIRRQIKDFRDKQMVNQSYGSAPFQEESALLDQKQ